MILKNSIEAIIEAAYLEEGLVDTIGRADIIVNPIKTDNYLVGRTIILNKPNISSDIIDMLLENNNMILTRTRYEDDRLKYYPYILRPTFKVMWSGEILDWPNSEATLDQVSKWLGMIEGEYDSQILYFPKILGLPENVLKDSSGNLSWLGWILHQVGINVKKDSKFLDMDVMKTKKLQF